MLLLRIQEGGTWGLFSPVGDGIVIQVDLSWDLGWDLRLVKWKIFYIWQWTTPLKKLDGISFQSMHKR